MIVLAACFPEGLFLLQLYSATVANAEEESEFIASPAFCDV